jgi:DNA-directed RNA polymerase III subunit RPC1
VQVAQYIQTVLEPGRAFIAVKLDLDRIQSLQLDIDALTVGDSIVAAPKMKIKHAHIRVLRRDKLIVFPPEQDRGKMFFALQSLRNALPRVIVKVSPLLIRSLYISVIVSILFITIQI